MDVFNVCEPCVDPEDLSGNLHWTDFVGNLVTLLNFRLLKIKTRLKVEPKLWGGIKKARKPECRIWGNATTLSDHFVHH